MRLPWLVAVRSLLALAMLRATCIYTEQLESQAPVIETCVQHPSTRHVLVQ